MSKKTPQQACRKLAICANIKATRIFIMRTSLLGMRQNLKNNIQPKTTELENLTALYEFLEEIEPYSEQYK